MTPVRTPDVVRGDVPGLLCLGMPIFVLRQTPEDDEAEPCDGERLRLAEQAVVTDHGNDAGWLVATGRTVDTCGPNWSQLHPADVAIDWSARASIYLCLAWLADRGRARLWMLPSTHGGRVEAWDGLSAWEVSAIVVSASVLRVAMGLGPVRDMLGPSVAWTASKTLRSGRRIELGHGGYARKSVATMTVTHTDDRRWFYGGGNVVSQSGERDWNAYPSVDGWTTWEAHARDVTDRAALADGCALLAPGGILLPD